MNEAIFYDTYAFFEVIRGNENYKKFEPLTIVTTIFNLTELNFALKREGNKSADEITRKYEHCLAEVSLDDIMKAMDFRRLGTDRNISTPDAIGYTVAKRLGIRFLTGDREFRGMENVEFVK